MLTGFDWSSCQGIIPPSVCAQLYARGTRFAFGKAFTGNDGADPDFDANVRNLRAAGIPVGAYVFPFCGLQDDGVHVGRDPIDQAEQHFAACHGVGSAKGDLKIATDWEWPAPKDFAKWGVTPALIVAWLTAYMERLEARCGYAPIVYTYPDWGKNVPFPPEFARFPLWAAEYDALQPISPWAGFSVLQTAGGSPQAMSRRYQQTTSLPNGVPVDTDVVTDEATLASLMVA